MEENLNQWQSESEDFFRSKKTDPIIKFWEAYWVSFIVSTVSMNGFEIITAIQINTQRESFFIDAARNCFYETMEINDPHLLSILHAVFSAIERKVQNPDYNLPLKNSVKYINHKKNNTSAVAGR